MDLFSGSGVSRIFGKVWKDVASGTKFQKGITGVCDKYDGCCAALQGHTRQLIQLQKAIIFARDPDHVNWFQRTMSVMDILTALTGRVII